MINHLVIMMIVMSVVYFDQRLGAAHSKTLVEIVIFSIFQKKLAIFSKNKFLPIKRTVDQRSGANLKKPVFG